MTEPERKQLRQAISEQRFRWLNPCRGCGRPRDERTFGCKACINRHEKRRQRGTVQPAPLIGRARYA